MVKYSCDTCLKTFAQKGHLETHKNRKRPCKKDNTIEALVEQKVQEAISKINESVIKVNTTMSSTIQSNNTADYLNKTRDELIAICKEKNIKGYSRKKKDEIIELLSSSTISTKSIESVESVENKECLTSNNTKKKEKPQLVNNIVEYSTKTEEESKSMPDLINEIIYPNDNLNNNTSHYIDKNKVLKVGTLFSGIGAFEHALDRLKINHKIVFACDIDAYVKKSYFANYNIDEDSWYTDVTQLNAKKYLDENIDIVVGGSPCQSFSFVGKQKGLEDERGNLIFEFIRVIDECKPKVFIFENVKGLTTHDKGKTFEIVINKFKELNYDLQYDILKATDYEIPQSRQRLFLIGIKKDSNVTISFPPKKCKLTLKMSDFLEDNVNTKYYVEEKGQHFAVSDKNLSKKYTQINGEISLCQKKNQQFNWHGDFIFEYRDIPEKYYLSDKVKDYVLKSGTKDFKTKPETDLDIARPLLSSMHKMHRAGVDNYVTNYGKLRKLTPRECLRLMGFSDNFKIVVSDTRMYQQAGNSIVVNVLMAIIKNIQNL
jgi:DNA (cytosine-5)-methyltransferase 1